MAKLLVRMFGIVFLAVSMMTLGACISEHKEKVFAQHQPSEITAPLPANQRFVIVMHPTIRADQYLLDTQTGKVWQNTQIVDYEGEPVIWSPMLRPDTPADVRDALNTIANPKPKTSKSKK